MPPAPRVPRGLWAHQFLLCFPLVPGLPGTSLPPFPLVLLCAPLFGTRHHGNVLDGLANRQISYAEPLGVDTASPLSLSRSGKSLGSVAEL